MVDQSHPRLSVVEQCRLLSLPRSTFYYTPQGETPLNLTLMCQRRSKIRPCGGVKVDHLWRAHEAFGRA